jgi:hypothetical protein
MSMELLKEIEDIIFNDPLFFANTGYLNCGGVLQRLAVLLGLIQNFLEKKCLSSSQ